MNRMGTAFLLPLILLAASGASAFPPQSETGVWVFKGERFVAGKPFLVSAADTSKVVASGSGSAMKSTHTWSGRSSTASFSWTADKDLARLTPGAKIAFTGTLSHSGDLSAMAGISLQAYGQDPGTGGPLGIVILGGFDGTANKAATRKGELLVPEGTPFRDRRMELRFEVYPGGATSALYRTYEWVPGPAVPAVKPPEPKAPPAKKPVPPPPAEKPDLHVDPDGIALFHTTWGRPGWWHGGGGSADIRILQEPSADRQSVTVRVVNRSSKTAAKGVRLSLSSQKAGQAGRTPIKEFEVGDIPPSGQRDWHGRMDLGGRNVEGETLFVRAFTPGTDDLNEEDNEAGIEFSIFYAHNGSRAFSALSDVYAFKNFGWEEREGEELIEGVLALLLSGTKLEANALRVLQRIWFPETFLEIAGVSLVNTLASIGGHCYGMAATSAIYFEEPRLRPIDLPILELEKSDASYNINLYQRAQMLPIFDALVEQKLFYDDFPDPARGYEKVKASLRDRKAILLGFTNDIDWIRDHGGEVQGHAVLAYKMIEVSGRHPVIYVYDSNYPETENESGKPLTDGMRGWEIDLSRNIWDRGGYRWASEKHLSAFRPHRTIPLDSTSARLINALKATYTEMVLLMESGELIMTALLCPADAVFTDAAGRRTGVVDGKVLTEIPGSKVLAKGEVEICRLPKGETYTFEIRGTGKGELGFDVITAPGPKESRLVSFADIPVEAGAKLTGRIGRGGAIESLTAGGRTITPSLVGGIRGDQPYWEKADGKPAGPAPSKTGAAARPADWTGAWTTDFGRMVLKQSGTKVTGTYDFKGGRIEGTSQDGVLKAAWIQTNAQGSLEFKMSPDGKSFSGRWGYGASLTGGGWSGKR